LIKVGKCFSMLAAANVRVERKQNTTMGVLGDCEKRAGCLCADFMTVADSHEQYRRTMSKVVISKSPSFNFYAHFPAGACHGREKFSHRCCAVSVALMW
jgi:hypothetical protein